MRKIFFITGLLAISFSAFSQSFSVTVTGVVSYSNGTPVEGVNVFISTIFEDSTFFFVNSMTDGYGIYAETIVVPDGQTEGEVSISSIGCTGIFDFFTLNWSINTITVVQDINWCDVENTGDTCFVVILPEFDTETSTATLYAVSSIQNSTYEWSDGSNGPSIEPVTTGTYCVTITGANGCIASGCYEYLSGTSALFTLNVQPLMISPQPVVTICRIQMPGEISGEHTLMITSVDGKVTRRFQNLFAHGTEATMDVSDLHSGLYVVVLQSRGDIWLSKLIKQNE